MKVNIIVLLALLAGSVCAAEVAVDKPMLTVSSTFRHSDGRVKDRDFHIVLELNSDGSVTGHYENWLERRYADKPPQLVIFKTTVSGTWSIKDAKLQLTLRKDNMRPDFQFEKSNGMSIEILKDTPNKPDAGDGL